MPSSDHYKNSGSVCCNTETETIFMHRLTCDLLLEDKSEIIHSTYPNTFSFQDTSAVYRCEESM